jgi:hypothetical protein
MSLECLSLSVEDFVPSLRYEVRQVSIEDLDSSAGDEAIDGIRIRHSSELLVPL